MVSTVRVLVTFTKFEELQHVDEFESAPSSPTGADQENPAVPQSSSSWFQWIKTPSSSSFAESSSTVDNSQELFMIPPDYKWITFEEKFNNPKSYRPKTQQKP